MKQQYAVICFFIVSVFCFAQTGVNTRNPLGAFHVDGNTDNAITPTAAQQTNDFIVTTSGATGIGTATLNSSAKLQIDAAN